jgi:diaminopimelate epimerase
MRFIKMHGLGNDYVYVNGFAEKIAKPEETARKVADRHFGVGGDGLILVLPPEPSGEGVQADVRMRMFNADGSESEMCGNGVRCVCKLAHDHGLSRANPMRVQTGRGVLTLRYTLNEGGKVDSVTVDMGEPILEAAKIPVQIPGVAPTARVVNVPGPADACPGPEAAPLMGKAGVQPLLTCVSMGNPHVVIYCDNVADVPLEKIGPILERHAWFPRRINVHYVQVHSAKEVTMRTWERGSGITMACGTGACAVAVAGVLTGKGGRKVLAHLPGGDLQLEWNEASNHVFMTGPATEVFAGSIDL